MKYIPAISFCGKILSILSHGWNLIDYHCKFQSELIGTIENSQKPMLFLQGEYGLLVSKQFFLKWNIQSLAKYPVMNYTRFGCSNMAKFL